MGTKKTKKPPESVEDVADRIAHDHGNDYVALDDIELNYVLEDEEILDIADKVFAFCLMASGIELYPYQQEFGRRIIQSLLLEDGEEITALFARQSGKTETVACVVVGCMVLLPILARIPALAVDSRISKFKDGLWVGIFAPTHEQGGIMHQRMAMRMNSNSMRSVCADPEIDLEIEEGRAMLHLENGSFVDCNSASPQAKIEGKTYHLILCEETQDILNRQLRKSIHPMAAATGGTIVKIGTPNRARNDFYDACTRGHAKARGAHPDELRTHFEFDYTVAQKFNPRYRKYIQREIERLGFDSEEFKMAYRLHWLVEHGMFCTPDLIREAGIQKRDTLKIPNPRNARQFLYFPRPDALTTQDRTTPNQVAAIDIGRSSDSTVITIGNVWWDNPIRRGYADPRYYIHVRNWLELRGDDHEVQYPKIMKFLGNFNLGAVVVDATGRGDPIYDRINHNIDPDGELGIEVIPFVFSTQSKHLAYTVFSEELKAGRFTFPDGKSARRAEKTRRFKVQMGDLEKSWRGKYMVVEARQRGRSHGDEEPHDDYPDSAAMLSWYVNCQGARTVETANNPLFDLIDRRRQNRGRERSRTKWGSGGSRRRR